MSPLPKNAQVAYLSAEIPALSATFVYEEMFGMQGLGISVLPVSVHKPMSPARGQEQLAARTYYLYEPSYWKVALTGVVWFPFMGVGVFKALKLLIADLLDCGPHRPGTWKLAFQFLAAVKLARILKANNCLHLHVHFAHVPSQIAMYASVMAGVPFTIMAHANDIFENGLLLRQKAERAVRMVTISEFNRAYLESIGLPKDKLAVVRCGVSFKFIPPIHPFLKQERYRIGTLGRLVEKKGIDVLIHAIAELKDRSYKIELSVAGDGPLQEELVSLANKLGVAQSMKFEGAMSHGDVANWMQGLDAFVLACKKDKNGDMDGIPVVLMEAMSQSIPVISTRISGVPELVVHERTGLLANPDDFRDLSVQIDRLLESPDLRERLVGEAVGHVENEFGKDVNLRRLLKFFPKEVQPASTNLEDR